MGRVRGSVRGHEGFWGKDVAGGATICSYGKVGEGGWGAVGVIPAGA